MDRLPPASRALGSAFALLLMAAAALPWWHPYGTDQPRWFLIIRLLVVVLGLGSFCLAFTGIRISLIVRAATLAILIPPLTLCILAVFDPADISLAVNQVNQASRLISDLTISDALPKLPWIHDRGLGAYAVVRNDYDLIDALECGASFAKEGFYLCELAAVLLLLWALRNLQLKGETLPMNRFAIIGIPSVILCIFSVPMAVGQIYWQASRTSRANGDTASALRQMLKAGHWDPRLDYDFAYHFELGRLYADLGKTSEPDYWATQADIYEANGRAGIDQVHEGYLIYRSRPGLAAANPTIPYRMANTFFREGNVFFLQQQDALASKIWQKGLMLDPSNVEIQWGLATIATRDGMYGEAIQRWKRIIADNEGVGLFRSRVFVSFIYRKMLTARAWSALGWCYFQIGDTENGNACKVNAVQTGSSYLPLHKD